MGRFEHVLERYEDERHQGILATLARLRKPSSSHGPDDGFLPLREAAAEMDLAESEVVELVHAGLLEADVDHDRLLVQPAIVSRLAVKQT